MTWKQTPRPRRNQPTVPDSGALSLELAILAPVLLAVFALVIAAGRIVFAGSSVDDAARAAARAASIQRSGGDAQNAALQVAEQTLAQQGLHCTNTEVDVPTGGFNVPLGQPASVTVTVRCTVRLSDVGAPGLPGAKTLTGTFTSAIDQYRVRGDGVDVLTRREAGA
ncbi:TadE family protein [Streptacidiphilus monticola]|uniref:TadE family protein n=1 Tax=Streptacidiphilus monticola TaxID=2161674 RepID=A0ABW1GBR2_9ACTN